MSREFARTVISSLLLILVTCAHAAPQTAQSAVRLNVDLHDAPKRIFHSKITFSVKPGPLTLVYPKWIPGEHSPTGPIVDLTGLHFRAGGKEIAWRRDDVDMYAFHCEIPAATSELEVSLDYLSPVDVSGSRERPSATQKLALLNWYMVVLYPQGQKSDDLTYVANLHIPAGWKYGTALPVARESAEQIEFQPATLTRLIDSPVIMGQYLRTIELSKGQKPEHFLHIAADGPAALAATGEQIQHLRQLIAETGPLFGARHYRRYDFLLSLSDNVAPDGVEHNESSDNRTPERLFLDPDLFETNTDLLPHEFFHSWNGKYRRPAGLTPPDYQTPLRGELLWVYEGLTQYYGTMLSARSGLWTPQRLRENLAVVAAYLNDRPGRSWRNLQDTAIAVQLLYGASPAGSSWRRGVDYYDESTLIWLEVDTLIRRETQGKKSLDDFCKKFYGGQGGEPKVIPYSFDDVVSTLQEVAPHDWKTFFAERLNSHGPGAPLGGLDNSGWKLVYAEVMNERQRAEEIVNHRVEVQFSLGLSVNYPGLENGDEITEVIWGSSAAQAGVTAGVKLVAVNGRKWTPELLREAIRRAKNGKEPIELLVENQDFFQTISVNYHDGERYPHLERITGKPDVLTEIGTMKAPPIPLTKD
ncbi:MAG TPA: M61 family peptidase [Candidatus Dormibacteraeota bacterium]|nr:M61 family peptidase [Candidatus Dormibacteraeota bacterium]